jgi:hypothetical protein
LLRTLRIYKVTLREDGSATYIGKENVERISTFTNDPMWPIKYQFSRLADAIERAGFYGLAGRYGAGTIDAEVAVTTVAWNGQAKTVITHNSAKDPKELWLVDTLIDGVAEEVHWVKQE